MWGKTKYCYTSVFWMPERRGGLCVVGHSLGLTHVDCEYTLMKMCKLDLFTFIPSILDKKCFDSLF